MLVGQYCSEICLCRLVTPYTKLLQIQGNVLYQQLIWLCNVTIVTYLLMADPTCYKPASQILLLLETQELAI